MKKTLRRHGGFTLIELMIVTAIIAVLSSVAIPTFSLLTLRAKAAERHEVMLRIKKAVADFYVQHGGLYTVDSSGTRTNVIVGDFQPAGAPSTAKRVPNWTAPGWADIWRSSEEVQGALYYSYTFTANDTGPKPTLQITAWGDLDGDTVPSYKTLNFVRNNGVYQPSSLDADGLPPEDPEAGAEDATSF
jgi:type IV pilus assembly protein PilA